MLRVLFSLLFAASLAAANGGSITGTVVDQTGAAIPAATVTLRSAETGAARHATSDADGSFAFADLAAGRYTIDAEHVGFTRYTKSEFTMTLGAAVRMEIAMEVEVHSDSVTVTESSNQVQTVDTQVGGTLNATKMASIPVNGRSFTDLLALQPGVMPVSSQQPNAVVMAGCTSAPPSGDLDPGNLSVSGQRETANGFSVNGSSAQEDFNMGAAIVPNLDSIQDLRVLTSNFNAEYGNFSGGQVLVATRSGANQLHGSAFEYLRNTALDARNYFAPDRAAYKRNQFGGTLGGAIRKDHVFYFADYQGTRMKQGVDTGLITVPSAVDRTGNLADMANSLTGNVNGQYFANLLSQRLGYAVNAGEPYYAANCVTTAQCVFPGARIPQSAWSAPAKSLLPYIPAPNHGDNIFSTSAYNEALRDDKGAVRIDAGTRFGSLAAYYFTDDYSLDNPYPVAQGGANVPGFSALSMGRAQLATLSLTTTFGPTAVNELQVGYMRTANNVGQPVGGVGPSLVSQGFVDPSGKPDIVALDPRIEGVENVSFNDFTIGVDTTGAKQANNTYQWSDNFSKVMGRHTMKVGASVHLDQVNIIPDAVYNGAFLFQGIETGSDFADFLIGAASNYNQADSYAFYLRNRYVGVFAQDTFQLSPKLTLNYGIRWDLLPPWREKLNQLQTLVLGEQSVVYPGAPAGLVFPGDPGVPSTLSPASHTNFAPRVGIAYSPDTKTSIRASYGVFYTAFEGLSAGIMSANPPYGYDYNSVAPPLFNAPFLTSSSGQDVGQRFPEPIPSAGASAAHPNTSLDWSQYSPITGVPSFYSRNTTPYSESYTVAVEREVARDTIITASYTGTQAHHLLVLISANPGNPALCLSLSQSKDVMPGSPTCGPFGESNTFVTTSGQTVQGTRAPFSSEFAAITLQKTIGNSAYNAIDVSVKHSGRAIDVQLAYSFGKSLDESSSLSEAVNPVNPRLSRALSAFDLRQNLVASYDWKLPLGKLKGWSLSGVTRFTTGLPVTLFNNNDTSLLGTIPNGINNDGVDTPNYAPGNLAVNGNPRNGRAAFNASLFSWPALGQMGTAARRFFYGPGMANIDLALHKTVRLSESRTVELRAEAFNVLNHAQFFGAASVDGNISSASFGQIVSAQAAREVQLAARFRF
jgi:hypothetical protein